MPFGGMAKLAELNSYPGPRHVLDISNKLQLSAEQEKSIQGYFDEMHNEAVILGEEILEVEALLDDHFIQKTIDTEKLKNLVEKSGEIYAKLRFSHLKAHLQTEKVLSSEQVKLYDKLRGYTSGDPCQNIPEGHPVEMWKLHHNCK